MTGLVQKCSEQQLEALVISLSVTRAVQMKFTGEETCDRLFIQTLQGFGTFQPSSKVFWEDKTADSVSALTG